MAFIFSGIRFISFATYEDVLQRDQRILEANESLTQTKIEDYLIAASQRMLTQIKLTDWWQDYCFDQNPALKRDVRLVPAVNPKQIKSSLQNFVDMNVYFALKEYIYPAVADFGNPESAEVAKIKFYTDQYNVLFKETIEDGSWYDFSANGTIEVSERSPNLQNRVRQR